MQVEMWAKGVVPLPGQEQRGVSQQARLSRVIIGLVETGEVQSDQISSNSHIV